jgi:hypothetical protein
VTAPGDDALSADAQARIARYEARAARIAQTLADYRRTLPTYRRAFAGLLVVGVGCFAFGRLPGLWATVSAVVISGGGYAMLLGRLWEVEADVTATRHEIAQLRHPAPR